VDSGEPQTETLHNAPDVPDAPVVPDHATSETGSAIVLALRYTKPEVGVSQLDLPVLLNSMLILF